MPVTTWLIRLTGNEDWDALDAGWLDRAEKVADLHWVESWDHAPEWLPDRDRARIDLDASAYLYAMQTGEIHALLGRAPSDQLTDEWEQQLELLEDLDSEYRYAVVWIGGEQAAPPGGEPRADPSIDRQIYIQPNWPEGEFNLMALDGDWGVGAFTKDGWEVGPDGTLWAAPDGAHPTTLRVRKQEGDLIFANNGDMGTMTYRIVPCDRGEPRA